MTETMLVVGEQDELVTLEELERRYLRRVLEHCRGNRSRAARILGISRRAIYDKMDRLGLRQGRAGMEVGQDGGAATVSIA
jgi:DNA-binding NtrC family response regulator